MVVDLEAALIAGIGDVERMIFQNKSGLRGLVQFLFSIWNFSAASRIRHAIRKQKPDVVHIHNWHFAIGPLAIRTIKKEGVPVILTLHNYRLICPSATLFKGNKLFLDSIHAAFPWKAVTHKVYRNSYFASFWLAFIVWFHKKIGTWKWVDRYILLTEMSKQIFESSVIGISEKQMVVKPNFLNDPGPGNLAREDFFLFIGRLAEEKGIETLLDAFSRKKSTLVIGGDGPLKSKVTELSLQYPNIRFLGSLDQTGVQTMMRRCNALVFPSIWYEGMPMTLLEAFATATPVIASDLGAMHSMIRDEYNGLLFAPGNAIKLVEKIELWEKLGEAEKTKFSQNARSTYETLYSPEINRSQCVSIYKSVIRQLAV